VTSKNSFERVVVLSNPVSTRSETVVQQLDDIRERFGNRVVELASYPCPADTTDMLKTKVRWGDVVVTAGGDGTARTAVEALADASTAAHHAVLLPLPGGYRNDLATQLHAGHMLSQPSKIIESSPTVDIMPLVTQWEVGGTRIERLSALYSGLGAMATTAHYIASPSFRERPGYKLSWVRDLYGLSALPWTIQNVDSFLVETDDGDVHELLDATVANSGVVAQYLHPPVELADHKAFYVELSSKRPQDVLPYIVRLMSQPWVLPPEHTMLHPGHAKRLTPLSETYLHTDGDAEKIPAYTPVSFGLHTVPFRAFYSRHRILHAIKQQRAQPDMTKDGFMRLIAH
jgi:diacylglycerol kinase family enzyme